MKFINRLYMAFAVCVAFTLAVGLFAMHQVGSLINHTEEISTNWMPSAQLLLAIKAEMREFRTQELQHILSTDQAEMDEWEAKMKGTLDVLERKFAAYEALLVDDRERVLFAELRREQAARIDAHMKVRALSRQRKNEEAIALARGEVSQRRAATAALVDRLVEFNDRGATDEVAAAASAASFARMMIPAAIVLAAVAAGALAFVIVRATMRQLGGDPADTKRAVERIAAGDLVTPIPLRAGDTDSLLAALSGMRAQLSDIVRTIVRGSEEIKTASLEVAHGNLDLSARTEQQSSSLQETAAALEQLTRHVQQAADNAGNATRLAQQASDTARRGGHVMGDVVATMQAIADSSRQVQAIISVIDGIAFQTNILALNAAVEAARAGEQGRGFAVVASEVRTLAQRSAEAAREIKGLIENSVGKVDGGARLVDDAGRTMQEVVASVQRVSDLIGDISGAAVEQSSGITQINQAVAQLDTVTQQNAALVEEASAATQSMEQQSGRLADAVGFFHVAA